MPAKLNYPGCLDIFLGKHFRENIADPVHGNDFQVKGQLLKKVA